MLFIDNISIEEEIISSYFSCDLSSCKGACCTFEGDFGAPLLDSETDLLVSSINIVKEYLPEKSKKIIERRGVFEGKPGYYTTVCINKRDCVFVYYDNNIALCALERAYFDGKLNFRKPVSCHLFPIRLRNNGTESLHYQQIEECRTAIKKGSDNKVYLYEFLKESLIRKFGNEWFDSLEQFIKTNQKSLIK
jgi:hypothetical protein